MGACSQTEGAANSKETTTRNSRPADRQTLSKGVRGENQNYRHLFFHVYSPLSFMMWRIFLSLSSFPSSRLSIVSTSSSSSSSSFLLPVRKSCFCCYYWLEDHASPTPCMQVACEVGANLPDHRTKGNHSFSSRSLLLQPLSPSGLFSRHGSCAWKPTTRELPLMKLQKQNHE